MIEKALAQAHFKVYGEGWDGPVDTECHLYLLESGAFAYGNQTCMVMQWDVKEWQDQTFDTRYEKVSVKTFKEYAYKFLSDYVKDTLTVEAIG